MKTGDNHMRMLTLAIVILLSGCSLPTLPLLSRTARPDIFGVASDLTGHLDARVLNKERLSYLREYVISLCAYGHLGANECAKAMDGDAKIVAAYHAKIIAQLMRGDVLAVKPNELLLNRWGDIEREVTERMKLDRSEENKSELKNGITQ